MDWMGDDIYVEYTEAKRIKKEQRKAQKQKKRAEKAFIRNSQSLVGFIKTHFHDRSEKDPKATEGTAAPEECLKCEEHSVHEAEEFRPEDRFVMPPRKYEPAEPVCSAEHVDPVNSPWLEECGMVKVGTGFGTPNVPKSSIAKGEKNL